MGQKLKLDFTGVESFQRVAEGLHTVKVASAEVKQSQGGNDMIVVAFEVTKGVDKGGRVYDNFVLTDTALWKLKGFLQAIGMKADGKVQLDVDKLLNKVCTINVQHEEYDGKLRARVESIMKFDAGEVAEEEDEDDETPEEAAEEKEEAPKKGKKAPMNKPEPAEEDDDDWDEDEAEEEEKPKKPAKKEKAPKKETKKASKKEESEDEDDDWDDDEDWDEE